MNSDAIPPLGAVFDGAKHFGLTDDEVWRLIDESLYVTGGDATVADYLDELTAALARGILDEHRRREPYRSEGRERAAPAD
jgi:hypothetical protein